MAELTKYNLTKKKEVAALPKIEIIETVTSHYLLTLGKK